MIGYADPLWIRPFGSEARAAVARVRSGGSGRGGWKARPFTLAAAMMLAGLGTYRRVESSPLSLWSQAEVACAGVCV